MARKRIIDPEFWSDEEIGKWPFEARLFYIGLWNFADDEGKFKAHPMLLKSQIFPYDMKIDINNLKNTISSKIKWYLCDGSQYGIILNFLKYQKIDKPTPSKLPNPGVLAEDSTNNQGGLPPNISKVNRSKVNISKGSSDLNFDFDIVWNKYPNKLGKKEAIRHFKATVETEEDFTNIKKALDNFIKSPKCLDPKFIPHGSTWFNNWQDWVDYVPPVTEKSKQDEQLETLKRLGIR